MDPFTYEVIRRREAHLKLPAWRSLRNTDRHKAKRLSPEDLIARRCQKIITREIGTVDRGKRRYRGKWIEGVTPV